MLLAEKEKVRGDAGCATGLDTEIIMAGKREIILCMRSSFHFKRQHLPVLTMVQLPRAEFSIPGKQQAESLEMPGLLFLGG